MTKASATHRYDLAVYSWIMADTIHTDGPSQPGRGRRSTSRLHVRLPARAVTLTQTRPAVLRDLSLDGAQFETDARTGLGSEVLLQWGPFEAFGEVVWVDELACGIRFHETIPTETLLATRELDDAHRLPRDHDIARASARAWVEGRQRL